MKRIKLSQGKFALVDDADYEFLNQYTWSCARGGKYSFRAVKSFHYVKNGKEMNRPALMHRIVMMSPPDFFEVDHKDGNQLNNQKSNLRICTKSQNLRNVIKRFPQSSKYRGVSKSDRMKDRKWRAQFRMGPKTHLDKFFATEIEAAKAYNEAVKKHGDEFCRLNEF